MDLAHPWFASPRELGIELRGGNVLSQDWNIVVLVRAIKGEYTDEYYADYDYWNTWVQDEIYDEFPAETDEEDEDEVMTTKDDDLLFYQDTFPVDKFVPYGKAMGSKRIEKSPTIPGAVLGLCNTLTWVEIEKKLRKKPPMKH
ncbi:hypothetical protein Tco_0727084 [Tanacetum coccineum]|uniref:Uncharacterized protein n=1 Tax=Tanacetum coccineum TaxID=301880 RepID=A0ABQ4YHE5_9ASTR